MEDGWEAMPHGGRTGGKDRLESTPYQLCGPRVLLYAVVVPVLLLQRVPAFFFSAQDQQLPVLAPFDQLITSPLPVR